MKKLLLTLFIILLFGASTFAGYMLINFKENSASIESVSDTNSYSSTTTLTTPEIETTDTTTVFASEEDVEVIYQDLYTACGHIIETKSTKFNSVAEAIIKEQSEQDNEYEVVEYTNTSITFRKEIDGYCPNHFLAKYNATTKQIVIYNLVSDTEKVVYDSIDVEEQNIRKDMIEKLKVGIEIDGKSNIGKLLEDIDS